MWISKNIAKIKDKNFSCSAGRIKQSADRRIAAAAVNGTKQYAMAAPSGMVYIPGNSEDAVVIQTDSGPVCIGVRIPENQYALKAGEMCLYSSGGATIFLKNDGKVIINGKEF